MPVQAAADRILIVDDDPTSRLFLKGMLDLDDCSVVEAATAEEALEINAKEDLDVILLDIILPEMGGIAALTKLRKQDETAQVIMVTGEPSLDGAIKAMRLGAYDYITKPVDVSRLRNVVHRAAAHRRLTLENRLLRRLVHLTQSPGPLVVASPAMQTLVDELDALAPTDAPILILGEPGSGKASIARHIHGKSGRAQHPFAQLNCREVTPLLAERELLGDEWTEDAPERPGRAGLIEVAGGGTLFLDNFAELAPSTQCELGRVLETRVTHRLGSDRQRSVDARLIAAAGEAINERVESGMISHELYRHLEPNIVRVPPLRERLEDIPELVAYYLERFRPDRDASLSGDAAQLLMSYTWPGNVRELANVIEGAVLHSTGAVIQAEDLPFLRPA